MPSHVSATGPALEAINPLEIPSWDERLADNPEASFFHGTAWLRVLQDTYGFRPVFFVRRRTGDRETVLPLMEVASWLTGRRGVALPFTDECAPLGGDPDRFQEFFSTVLDQARLRGWRYLECRGGRALFGDAPASTSFLGHRLDLRGGEAQLFAGTDPAARRAVRKAEQSGLNVTISQELGALRTFYTLLCRTRRRHGVPAQPFRFFVNIHRHVFARNQGHVVLAHLGGTPVAGAVFFHFRDLALYKFGASDETRQHLRANNLVMWEAIKWHLRAGFKQLDFGRTSIGNEGLRRYKLGWGATERRVDYVRYDLGTDNFVTVKDGACGWHNRVFRLLPISLSRLAGSLLYKHVA
jgi:hypothetical protein